MKLTFTITLFFLFSFEILSQTTISNSENEITITKMNEISLSDFLFSLTTPLPFPGAKTNTSSLSISLGTDFRFNSMKFGALDVNYGYNIFVTETFDIGAYSSIDDINKKDYQFIYSIPLIKKFKQKEMTFGVKDQFKKKYLTTINGKYLVKTNIRIGLSQDYSTTATHVFSQYLVNTYPDIYFLGDYGSNYGAEVCQSVKTLKFGISKQKCINTQFEAENSLNNKFKGKKANLLTYYIDYDLLLNSTISRVHYSYLPFGSNSSIHTEQNVNLIALLKLHRLGVSLGVEYSDFDLNFKNSLFTTKIACELGFKAGYYENYAKAMYLNVKFIGMGIGSFYKGLRN